MSRAKPPVVGGVCFTAQVAATAVFGVARVGPMSGFDGWEWSTGLFCDLVTLIGVEPTPDAPDLLAVQSRGEALPGHRTACAQNQTLGELCTRIEEVEVRAVAARRPRLPVRRAQRHRRFLIRCILSTGRKGSESSEFVQRRSVAEAAVVCLPPKCELAGASLAALVQVDVEFIGAHPFAFPFVDDASGEEQHAVGVGLDAA
jgi:hypothetical protein